MHIIFWLFIGIPGLIMAYGILRTGYRLMRGRFPFEPTELDAFGLIAVLCGAVFFVKWLFG